MNFLSRLVACALLVGAGNCGAQSWYVRSYGSVITAAQTGGISYSPTFNTQSQQYDSGTPSNEAVQQLSSGGVADAASRGMVNSSLQASDGTASSTATLGALHAQASADSSIGESYSIFETHALSSAAAGWHDTLTFHTGAGGADYTFVYSLLDGVSTTLAPNGNGDYQGSVGATALTFLSVIDPLSGFAIRQLQINDGAEQSLNYIGQPVLTLTPPQSRTVSAVLHVVDGQSLILDAYLGVGAFANNGNAVATANASDTAYFNLFTNDADASYGAASGTTYLTSGDPSAPVSAVPEPETYALVTMGLALIGLARRRSGCDPAAGGRILERPVHGLTRLG